MAIILVVSPEVCGIDGMSSIRTKLEYEGIPVTLEIRIASVYYRKIGRTC
jgi:hypothetical protein